MAQGFVRFLFFVTVIGLAGLGVTSLLRMNQNPIYLLYALMMFADAVVMHICGLYIHKHRWAYWFAVVALSLNIVLTIFDQVGWADVLFMLLNFVILVLLFLSRREPGLQ